MENVAVANDVQIGSMLAQLNMPSEWEITYD